MEHVYVELYTPNCTSRSSAQLFEQKRKTVEANHLNSPAVDTHQRENECGVHGGQDRTDPHRATAANVIKMLKYGKFKSARQFVWCHTSEFACKRVQICRTINLQLVCRCIHNYIPSHAFPAQIYYLVAMESSLLQKMHQTGSEIRTTAQQGSLVILTILVNLLSVQMYSMYAALCWF